MLALSTWVLAARLVGKEKFGELGIIQSTVGMFGLFADLGLSVTATKYVAEFRLSDKAKAGRIMALSRGVTLITGGIVAAILVLSAPYLAKHCLAAPRLAPELRISSLLIWLSAINGAQTGALAGFEAYDMIALANAFGGIVNLPCLVIGAWLADLPGMMWGLVMGQAASVGLSRWMLQREAGRSQIKPLIRDMCRELRVLSAFAVPSMIASSMAVPTVWYLQTIVVKRPGGYDGMAEYSVGLQLRNIIQFLPALLSTAYLPVAASVAGYPAGKRFRLMYYNAGAAAALTSLGSIVIIIGSPYILRAYGNAFASGMLVVVLLLAAGIAISANNILVQTLLSAGRAWLRLISNAVFCVIALLFGAKLIPSYGATGLAASLCLAQFLHLGVQILLTHRALDNECNGTAHAPIRTFR